jgi:hypothetical protein
MAYVGRFSLGKAARRRVAKEGQTVDMKAGG